MPDAKWAIPDPPKEAELCLIAYSVPDRAVALSSQGVDDAENEFNLSILISVKLITITDSTATVEAAKIGDCVPRLWEDHDNVVARRILEEPRLSDLSPPIIDAINRALAAVEEEMNSAALLVAGVRIVEIPERREAIVPGKPDVIQIKVLRECLKYPSLLPIFLLGLKFDRITHTICQQVVEEGPDCVVAAVSEKLVPNKVAYDADDKTVVLLDAVVESWDSMIVRLRVK